MLWQEFAPSDEELEAYRKGEEWDPQLAEQRRRLKVRLVLLCVFNNTDIGVIVEWCPQAVSFNVNTKHVTH